MDWAGVEDVPSGLSLGFWSRYGWLLMLYVASKEPVVWGICRECPGRNVRSQVVHNQGRPG